MKYLKFLLIFILLLVPLTTASANNLPKITLKLDKKILKTDVAPVIVNDRTLVPIRVISEASGAGVEWDGENKVVTITGKKVEIGLKIDSNEAQLNGETVTLDAPAQIISDRTMVPVRFVAESFGYTVEWNGETMTVFLKSPESEKPPAEEEDEKDDGDVQPGGVANLVTVGSANTDKGYRITIKFDAPLSGEYSLFELENPQRLIIDIENAQIDFTRQFDFENETVKAARVGNHDDYMRVVIDMEEPAEYKKYMSENGDALILFFDVESDEEIVPDKTDEEEEKEPQKPDAKDGIVIVIDPGHGGSDPGALGKEDGETVARESEVNLAVSLILRDILEDVEGITVVMTREEDERVSLGDRCVISNEAEADLFVSVHSNAMEAGNEHINGTMVFYGAAKDKSDPWLHSKELAKSILEYLCDAIETTDLGIQNGDQLAVIRGTEAPAVLVELAFITNPDDREKLTDPDYQEYAAEGIAEGILECLEDVL